MKTNEAFVYCPICQSNVIIAKTRTCVHIFGRYNVHYCLYNNDNSPFTIVFDMQNNVNTVLHIDGHRPLDEERIERLLILK